MRVGEDSRVGTVLAGYRVESLLGQGGMSVVYLAEDLRLKRKVALRLSCRPIDVWATSGTRRSMICATVGACHDRFTFVSTMPRPPRSRWFAPGG